MAWLKPKYWPRDARLSSCFLFSPQHGSKWNAQEKQRQLTTIGNVSILAGVSVACGIVQETKPPDSMAFIILIYKRLGYTTVYRISVYPNAEHKQPHTRSSSVPSTGRQHHVKVSWRSWWQLSENVHQLCSQVKCFFHIDGRIKMFITVHKHQTRISFQNWRTQARCSSACQHSLKTVHVIFIYRKHPVCQYEISWNLQVCLRVQLVFGWLFCDLAKIPLQISGAHLAMHPFKRPGHINFPKDSFLSYA